MARRAETSLDREALVAAAFAVVADVGLDGLSMRKLGERLSVQAPALYWHIADKSELLRLMANVIYGEARAAVPASADWRAWLVAFGRALRKTLGSRRDGARICAVAKPDMRGTAQDRARAIAEPLTALGLDQGRALSFQASVISLALGWAMFEENGPMHDFLHEMMDFDASFEIGLQALVNGYDGAPER